MRRGILRRRAAGILQRLSLRNWPVLRSTCTRRGGDSGSISGVDDDSPSAAGPPHNVTDFGDYELLEKMGGGGQGLVYRARQKSLNRTVALKIIGLGQLATKAHLKRFRARSRSGSQSGPSLHRSHLRNRRARRLMLLQHEIHRGRAARRSGQARADVNPARGGIDRRRWRAPFITPTNTAFCIETSNRETFCWMQKANRISPISGLPG